jgi:NAD-reducing hydrogenase small subunit
MAKPTVATTSLAGCFGCHMSLLDIDERIVQLAERVAFDRSPLNDIKTIGQSVDVGLVEGGCANEDNVRVLREFRKHCRVLVAVGDCAISGGVPALRNTLPVASCLEEAFLNGPTVFNPSGTIPGGTEIPPLLDKVYPCREVVRIDHHLPGCPPSADAIFEALTSILDGKPIELSYEAVKYD